MKERLAVGGKSSLLSHELAGSSALAENTEKEPVQPWLIKFHLHIPLVHWPWPLGTDKAKC